MWNGYSSTRASFATGPRSKPPSATPERFSTFGATIGSFDTYLWRFVDGKPIENARRSIKDVPAETDLSRALSKDLARRGFRFVGPTICYAFMQAVGLVNDHLVHCFRRSEVRRLA